MAVTVKYINGKEINYKRYQCGLNGEEPKKIKGAYINLYVVITRNCNVNCKFCEFCKDKVEFDIDKFRKVIDEISREFMIGRVSFTGGEPTLCVEYVRDAVKILKEKDKYIFTSINTNGTHMDELVGIDGLDNIALSRHSIDESKNAELMGVIDADRAGIITNNGIREYKDKDKIHLSCNLVSGYVDSKETVFEYLEFASQLGIRDVGFVSLMSVNEFTQDKFVDFKSLELIENERLINNKEWCKEICGKEVCRCRNYIYRAENKELVAFYSRYVVEREKVCDYLVFENNELRQGFNGDVIV